MLTLSAATLSTVVSSAVALSTVSLSAVALSAQRLVLLLPQMVYVLVPITGAVVAVVLIYAYAAIPNASGALSHFFSNNAHTRQEHGIVYVQMQLGDAKVSCAHDEGNNSFLRPPFPDSSLPYSLPLQTHTPLITTTLA